GPEGVGAKPVGVHVQQARRIVPHLPQPVDGCGGRRVAQRVRLVIRLVGRDLFAEHCQHQKEQDDRGAERGLRAAKQVPHEAAGREDAGSAPRPAADRLYARESSISHRRLRLRRSAGRAPGAPRHALITAVSRRVRPAKGWTSTPLTCSAITPNWAKKYGMIIGPRSIIMRWIA